VGISAKRKIGVREGFSDPKVCTKAGAEENPSLTPIFPKKPRTAGAARLKTSAGSGKVRAFSRDY
jgi:hypothetical protein